MTSDLPDLTQASMKPDHAHRIDPCRCDICHTAHVRRDILRGVVLGLAGVGVLVAVWVVLVLVLTGGPR